jgi:hypothetical protein
MALETSCPKEGAVGQVGRQQCENQPTKEGRLDAIETGSIASANKLLKCHPPEQIHMSQERCLRKKKWAIHL